MRTALVTGAAGAIGSAVVARLRADGLRVAGADLADGADHRCDVRLESDVVRLRGDVERAVGAPGVLVNMAGVFFEHRITELSVDDWDLLLDTNLKGTFLMCKTFLPAMIAAGSGVIVNVASTAGVRGGRNRPAYCAAKAGVVNLSRSLALDHGADGVRVCCVCPGLIDTPMADWITSRPDALREWEQTLPAGRIGTVEDIAAAVSFLASDAAAYTHGTVLVVDGGVTAA